MSFNREGITRIWYRLTCGSISIGGAYGLLTQPQWFWLAFLLVYPVIMLLYNITPKEYITVDENGIVCLFKNTPQWSFRWEEIAEMKIGSNRLGDVVHIVPIPEVRGTPPYGYEPYHFEYSREAKKALAAYKPEHITLTRYR